MYKGLITAGSYTSGNIPFTKLNNTNNVFTAGTNSVTVNQAGIVDTKVNIILTATVAGSLTATLNANGNPVNGASVQISATADDTYTLTINDALYIVNDNDTDRVALTVSLSGACTLVGGEVIFEYRR